MLASSPTDQEEPGEPHWDAGQGRTESRVAGQDLLRGDTGDMRRFGGLCVASKGNGEAGPVRAGPPSSVPPVLGGFAREGGGAGEGRAKQLRGCATTGLAHPKNN